MEEWLRLRKAKRLGATNLLRYCAEAGVCGTVECWTETECEVGGCAVEADVVEVVACVEGVGR